MLEAVPAERSFGRWFRRCCPIPIGGVRIRAAAVLAAVPTASQPPADRERFERAAAEFVAAQRLNADRPEARSALGNFYARRRLFAEAEAEYKAALKLSPQYAPASINLGRPLPADRTRRRRREHVARGDLSLAAGRRAASCARPDADPAEEARRRPGRACACGRARARPGTICLCLRRRPAFGRPQR